MKCRIQLDIVSNKLDQISILNEQIRQELDGYSGPLGGQTCIRCKLVNEIGWITEPQDGSDSWIYRRSVDYHIRYKVTTPTLGVAGVAVGGSCSIQYDETTTGGVVVAGVALEEVV